MMNPFTAHTQQQGVTYTEHWCFAMGIACRLLVSVVVLTLHAIMPFIPIAPRHDLEAMTAFLVERNKWIESAKRVSTSTGLKHSGTYQNLAMRGGMPMQQN